MTFILIFLRYNPCGFWVYLIYKIDFGDAAYKILYSCIKTLFARQKVVGKVDFFSGYSLWKLLNLNLFY